jgi:Protein of unknown function (DUF3618)
VRRGGGDEHNAPVPAENSATPDDLDTELSRGRSAPPPAQAGAEWTCDTCSRNRTQEEHVSSDARTPDQITADIATTRNRLAGTIDQLVYRAKPKTIAQRQLESTKASFYDTNGALRKDRVAIVAGVAVGFVALIVAIRKIAG